VVWQQLLHWKGPAWSLSKQMGQCTSPQDRFTVEAQQEASNTTSTAEYGLQAYNAIHTLHAPHEAPVCHKSVPLQSICPGKLFCLAMQLTPIRDNPRPAPTPVTTPRETLQLLQSKGVLYQSRRNLCLLWRHNTTAPARLLRWWQIPAVR
jgi:hypothetical protein